MKSNHQDYSTNRILFYLVIAIFYTAVFLFSYNTTLLPSYEKIPQMDGNQYLKIWQNFNDPAGYPEYEVSFPFNSRILYMALASLFPDSFGTLNTLVLLNYLFGLGTLLLLFNTWNRLAIPILPSLFLLAYTCLHWSGIIRQYMIDPVGVDVPYLFLLTLLLHCILFQHYRYLFVLTAIGIAVKEAILPFILTLWMIRLFQTGIISFQNRKPKIDLSKINRDMIHISIALLSGMLCVVLLSIFYPPSLTGWKQNSLATIATCINLVLKDPVRVLNWLTGIMLFFGMFFYPFIKAAILPKYRTGQYAILLWLSLLGLSLAIIGGGDHTRIAFLSFPFFFTYLLLYWKENPDGWFLYLIPAFLLTKCWRYLPTPTDSWELFSSWYPEYSGYRFFLNEWIVVIISGLVLYFYDKTKKRVLPT